MSDNTKHLSALAAMEAAWVKAGQECGRQIVTAFTNWADRFTPATPPAKAVEADEVPERDGVLWGPGGYGYSTSGNNGLSFAEPTPEQVEAEAVCNCDYVARGGPGATPERPVEHHPLCDINLPAGKRSGIREQVEADLAQDEQAHARYYAQPGVPVEKVREVAETLLSLADAPEYQQPKYDDVNAVWREAARRVAALLPEEPTS